MDPNGVLCCCLVCANRVQSSAICISFMRPTLSIPLQIAVCRCRRPCHGRIAVLSGGFSPSRRLLKREMTDYVIDRDVGGDGGWGRKEAVKSVQSSTGQQQRLHICHALWGQLLTPSTVVFMLRVEYVCRPDISISPFIIHSTHSVLVNTFWGCIWDWWDTLPAHCGVVPWHGSRRLPPSCHTPLVPRQCVSAEAFSPFIVCLMFFCLPGTNMFWQP